MVALTQRTTRLTRSMLRLVAVCALLLSSYAAHADQNTNKEYALKAAYLYNFTKFVLWPDEKDTPLNSAINICVKGEMPEPSIINQMQGRQTRGRPLSILSVNDVAAIDQCHVLYMRNLSESEIHDTIEKIGDKPILTVGEQKDFALANGIIEFILQRGRIKLKINHDRAKQTGIHISAQLLEVASVVARKDQI